MRPGAMSASLALVVAAAGSFGCAWFWVGRSRWELWLQGVEPRRRDRPGSDTTRPAGLTARRSRAPWLGAALAGIALAVVIPAPWGVAIGSVATIVLARLIGSLPDRGSVRRDAALAQAAPLVADLLAASLAAGATIDRSVAVTAEAIDGPAAGVLATVSRRLALGEAPERAWQQLAEVEGFGPIVAAIARSHSGGVSARQALLEAAREQRARRHAHIEAASRRAAVKTAGPLALCFLPAFLVVAVVPVVASLFAATFP